MSIRAYIGLGSNVGDRRALLEAALERLAPTRVSTIVETEPWGRGDQARFLNAVAEVDTPLEGEKLLDRLQDVERELGRVRTDRWGPRTLDLDLLLYGDLVIRTDRLAVPHPWLAQRRFVLEGLAELCPEYRVPGLHRTIRELLGQTPDSREGGARDPDHRDHRGHPLVRVGLPAEGEDHRIRSDHGGLPRGSPLAHA